ncbi:hypothetical protein DFH08DRAFT_954195 [Mycena albidolilacea]|uniref:Uncharacterized protein n=1 Tax=Mycena albidolilacea TaxID=1033008 RepID=A0AAD7AEX9_9AGAR|nr:hypothetical protein DFH08DRAFT_954195 [Mycena albidolilacea]
MPRRLILSRTPALSPQLTHASLTVTLPYQANYYHPLYKITRLEPFRGVTAIRPVPRPSALHNAREATGKGANGVWTATNFVLPAADTPQNVFPVRQVAGSSKPFQRFCLRRLYAGQYSPAGITTMYIFTDGACTNNGSSRRPVGRMRLRLPPC